MDNGIITRRAVEVLPQPFEFSAREHNGPDQGTASERERHARARSAGEAESNSSIWKATTAACIPIMRRAELNESATTS